MPNTAKFLLELMAKGILGRKLGMTQIFDTETGGVTGVTVIAGGPVPGRPGEDARTRTATTAVQLAFDPVTDWKLTRPELGHLKRFGVGAHRTLVEFRGGIDGAVEGETVTVAVFEPGDEVKVAGIGIGKGFQGTIKRHNFSSGPRGARLAQHPRSRLGRRLGDALARLQGRQAWPAGWAASASPSSG